MAAVVTVIIPIYKVEKYIRQCIDSVLSQTYKELQIILVDDGSPDTCPEICDQYQKQDPRVEVIHKQNAGLGMARNSGLTLAKGNYVLFVDSDDWILPDHVKTLVKAMEHSATDIVVHGYKRCLEDNSDIQMVKLTQTGVFEDTIQHILMPIIAADDRQPNDVTLPVGVCFKLFKLQLIQENRLQFLSEKEVVSEDIFFNIQYLSVCKRGVIIDEYGYVYRMNPQSISHAYQPERMERSFVFYRKLTAAILKDKRLHDHIQHRIQRCYIGKCRSVIRMIEASDLNYKIKIKECRKLLRNVTLRDSLSQFPIQNYRFSLRIIALLMKRRWALGVLIAFWVKRVLHMN